MKNKIGGTLQGISLDAFLQMAQMEQITCTLSVTSGDRTGALFLQGGNLISAEADGLDSLNAARHIISWEKTVIEITEICDKTVDEIKQPLMNILMEAMRLRDEAESDPPPEKKSASPPEKTTPDSNLEENRVQDKTESSPPPEKESPPPSEKTVPATHSATDTGKQPTTKTQAGFAKSKVALANAAGLLKRPIWKYTVTGLGLLLFVALIAGHFLSVSKRNRLAYEALINTIDAADSLEEKLRLLDTYATENPEGKYEADVIRRIESLREQLATNDFKAAELAASQYAEVGKIDAAIAVYQAYLHQTPGNRYRNKAETAIKTLSDRLEEIAFKEMQTIALAQGPERLTTYLTFLESYPDSSRRQEILDLVSDMENEYFVYVEQQMREHEASENWAECVELGQTFLSSYPESEHAETITKWLVKYREEFQATQTFEQLRTRAARLGEDYEAALTVYTDYLKAYPGSPVRDQIEQEIEVLTGLVEERRLGKIAVVMTQKLAESGDRFVVETDETVRDKKTGLTWCLLDSQAILNRCVTYEEAKAWVSSLKIGDHDDWRLPTSEELSALFRKPQSFPVDASQWYWSSRNQRQYNGIWVIDVEAVDPGRTGGAEMVIKKSWQCGAVRAVRGP